MVVGAAPGLYLGLSSSGDRSQRWLELSRHVDYDRFVLDDAVVHWVTVEVGGPDFGTCLVPVMSRPADDGTIAADVVTGFVDATGATVAVNVAYFYPFIEYPHWSTYPTVGEEVTAIGLVLDDGVVHGRALDAEQYLILSADGAGSVGPFPTEPRPGMWAEPGRLLVVDDGQVVVDDDKRYPRTVVGVDRDGGLLHLVVVDGKQPGYSTGLPLAAVGRAMVERGVDQALEFDGGGSASLAATVDGEPVLLNRPSHTRIPGRQRAVATFLGFTDRC